ncbi:MAG: 1-phosphofructokinase family hexose kinase [Christensenellaceae bacterium]|jgi:1-phosphofructokinase
MYICVYLNPTIDRTIYLQQLEKGKINRTQRFAETPSGKALNVAVALRQLGEEAMLAGVLPAKDGRIAKRLEEYGVLHSCKEADAAPRYNIKLVDMGDATLTEVNEAGAVLPQALLCEIMQDIAHMAKKGDTVVLTGSLPPGCPKEYYATLIGLLNAKGVYCALDAEGEVLALGMKRKPLIIKPNLHELRGVVSPKSDGVVELALACREIAQSGIRYVALTLGERGALLCSREEAFYAPALALPVQSTVGAGDAMLAGILTHLEQGMECALRAGAAYASAAVLQEGTDYPNRETFWPFYDRIRIEKVGYL